MLLYKKAKLFFHFSVSYLSQFWATCNHQKTGSFVWGSLFGFSFHSQLTFCHQWIFFCFIFCFEKLRSICNCSFILIQIIGITILWWFSYWISLNLNKIFQKTFFYLLERNLQNLLMGMMGKLYVPINPIKSCNYLVATIVQTLPLELSWFLLWQLVPFGFLGVLMVVQFIIIIFLNQLFTAKQPYEDMTFRKLTSKENRLSKHVY